MGQYLCCDDTSSSIYLDNNKYKPKGSYIYSKNSQTPKPLMKDLTPLESSRSGKARHSATKSYNMNEFVTDITIDRIAPDLFGFDETQQECENMACEYIDGLYDPDHKLEF